MFNIAPEIHELSQLNKNVGLGMWKENVVEIFKQPRNEIIYK